MQALSHAKIQTPSLFPTLKDTLTFTHIQASTLVSSHMHMHTNATRVIT